MRMAVFVHLCEMSACVCACVRSYVCADVVCVGARNISVPVHVRACAQTLSRRVREYENSTYRIFCN